MPIPDKLTIASPLLAAIRKHEAPKGYGQIYGGAKGVPKGTDVSRMTLNQVLALQQAMLDKGSVSTACGGYQFLRKTLIATIMGMGLSGAEIWNPALQDRMALYLMEKRGFSKYLSGQMTLEEFGNSLAREWASLPVLSDIQGGSRKVKRGQSFYAGDGLNKSFHKPEAIEALLRAMQSVPAGNPGPAPVQPPEPLPDDLEPPVVEEKPSIQKVAVWLIAAGIAALAAYLGFGGQ